MFVYSFVYSSVSKNIKIVKTLKKLKKKIPDLKFL